MFCHLKNCSTCLMYQTAQKCTFASCLTVCSIRSLVGASQAGKILLSTQKSFIRKNYVVPIVLFSHTQVIRFSICFMKRRGFVHLSQKLNNNRLIDINILSKGTCLNFWWTISQVIILLKVLISYRLYFLVF